MMTTPTEQVLREVFAEQAAPIHSATDFYAAAGAYNRRRRRRQVVAAAVAAAVVAAGVPLTLTGVRGGLAAPTAAGPTASGSTAAAPPVRGSLAGDKALIAQGRQFLLAVDGIDPASVQVSYAEQYQGYRVLIASGVEQGSGMVHSMIATGAPGKGLIGAAGGSGTPESIDAQLGQKYTAPQSVLTRIAIGDRSFGVVIFPPGSRATVRTGSTIGADCYLAQSAPAALPLRDGAAFFPVGPADAPYVTVYRGQKPLTAQALQPSGDPTGMSSVPPAAEIATQFEATLRGDAPSNAAVDEGAYTETSIRGTGVGETPDRYIGVWAGRLPGGKGYASLVGGHFRSGATVLQGDYSDPGGQGVSGWLTGCMPAGGLDDTVLAARLTDLPGKPLVIVAPAGAVRAEVSFGSGAPVSVQLTEGGGYLVHGGTAGAVRALDAGGRVVGTGVAGRRLVGIPIQPR